MGRNRLKAAMVKGDRIKIIIPTLNERESIGEMLRCLQKMGYHDILVIDGNSKDGTAKLAAEHGAQVIMQNGTGKGQALRQVFQNCSDADIFVIMDADGSMAPEEIPSFTKAIELGVDVVKGSRFLPHGGSEDFTAIRHVGNRLLTLAFNLMFVTKYTDLCYGYMAFRKEALMKLADYLESQKFEIEAEICIKSKMLGLSIAEVPSFERARRNGVSNLSTFKDGFGIFRLLLKELLNGN